MHPRNEAGERGGGRKVFLRTNVSFCALVFKSSRCSKRKLEKDLKDIITSQVMVSYIGI